MLREQGLKPSAYNIAVGVDGDLWIANTASGGVVRIGACRALDEAALEPAETQALADNGILVPYDQDELGAALSRLRAAQWSVDVLGVTIAPTLGCNFACAYCFERKTADFTGHATMDAETCDRLVAHTKGALKGREGLSLRWFGGEPLLAPAQMRRISAPLIEYAEAQGLSFSANVQTNGYLLDEDALGLLRECRVSEIHISIDGGRADHDRSRYEARGQGTYDRILANIARAARQALVVVRVNTTRKNADGIPALLRDLADAGGGERVRVYFSPVYAHFNGAKGGGAKAAAGFASVREYALIESSLYREAAAAGFAPTWDFLKPKALPCSALKMDAFMVGPRGEIMKCDHEFGVPDLSLGDLAGGVWNLQRLSRWTDVTPADNPYCGGCPLLPSCWGHCDSLRKQHADPAEACPSKKYNAHARLQIAAGAQAAPLAHEGRVGIYHRARRARAAEEALA